MVITVLIVSLSGIIYLTKMAGNGDNKKNNTGLDSSNIPEVVQSDINDAKEQSGSIIFDEYIYKISDNDVITARYMKYGQLVRICSLSPVSDKSVYDISSSGNAALYRSRGSDIWVLYNDGTQEKVTPDKYGSMDKVAVMKENPGFTWASRPEFTLDGNVRFVSDIPVEGNIPKKSIWEINLEDGSMKIVYTPVNEGYLELGYRDDRRLMILDGDSIATIDTLSNAVETIDVKGKYIIKLSFDGLKLIYMKKDENDKPDLNSLYVMDSKGQNMRILPGLNGYTATDAGAWDDKSSKYAFIMKPLGNTNDRVAVVSFDDGFMNIVAYSPENDIKFPDGCELRWTGDSSISVDTGDSIVNIDLP